MSSGFVRQEPPTIKFRGGAAEGARRGFPRGAPPLGSPSFPYLPPLDIGY